MEIRTKVNLREMQAKQLISRLLRPLNFFQVFNQVVLGLSSERDLNKLLQLVVDSARRLVRARLGVISLTTPDKKYQEVIALFKSPAIKEECEIDYLPQGLGVPQRILREGKPLRLKDLYTHPASIGLPKGHLPLRGLLGVPLINPHKQTIGLLMLSGKEGNKYFTEKDEKMLILLAQHAVLAIERTKLLKNLEDTKNFLATLLEDANDLIYTIDLEGNFTFLNKKIEEYGYLKEELIGRLFLSVLSERHRGGDLERLLNRKSSRPIK